MVKKFKSTIFYLMHDLNSATALLGAYSKKVGESALDLEEKINLQIKKIKDIQDYIYKWAKEQEDWNDS